MVKNKCLEIFQVHLRLYTVDQTLNVNDTYTDVGIDLANTNSLKFAVMSCDSVKVALGPVSNFTSGNPFYEFALQSTYHYISYEYTVNIT